MLKIFAGGNSSHTRPLVAYAIMERIKELPGPYACAWLKKGVNVLDISIQDSYSLLHRA